MPRRLLAALLTCAALAAPAAASAQSAENVLVVINTQSPASVEVGEYYANKRGVPAVNVVRIDVPPDETVSYELFARAIEGPVGTWMVKNSLQDRILYIVLTKGVPIRVRGSGGRQGSVASVDSELTLLYRKLLGAPTSVVGTQNNPYFLGSRGLEEARRFTRIDQDVYLVTRLDGFTVPDVIGLIERGSTPSREGRFVLDQRAHLVDSGGDRWLHQAAERLEAGGASGRVVLENTKVTAAADGPVLGYYSWGSNDAALRRRGTGLTFAPGAIAGWFVSTDGRTFQEPPADWVPGPSTRPPSMFGDGSQSIAADLVREGVTGMAAHVDEPYLDGTTRPQVLFPAYHAGFNLAEAYYLAMPFLSWRNIVLGDPLCAPFRERALPASEIDKGIDPETELPALFAERQLAIMTKDGLDPEAIKLVQKSSVARMREDDAGAEDLLRRAVDLDPRLVVPALQLATVYEQRGEYDRAIGEYRRVVDADPKNVVALNNLAYALAIRKGDLTESLDLAKRAVNLSAEPAVADTLGWIHFLRGEHATAKPLIERALAAAPKTAEIQFHAAAVHAALGEVIKARAELEDALKLDPALAEREDVKALRAKLGT